MRLVCPLTPFVTHTVTRGRGTGNNISSRAVLACDNWNWVVGTQAGENANIKGEKFYGNMTTIIPILAGEYGEATVNKIIDTLVTLTSKPFSDRSNKNLGKRLDDHFGTSQMREYPPKVISRLFNGATDNDGPEEKQEDD